MLVTIGNAEADKLIYFKNKVQDFCHRIQLERIQEHQRSYCLELGALKLIRGYELIGRNEVMEKHGKMLGCIKEEFGYDVNAWNYVRSVFGDKGSLKSAEKLQINRNIAKIAHIHHHSSQVQGVK